MVGKSGKVGGPGGPTVVSGESSTGLPAQKKSATDTRDSFTRGARAQAPNVPAQATGFAREVTGASNLFQLARTNPQAAKQLVASLTAQATTALNELEAARVAAQAVLEKLAKERFTKEAMKKQAEELKKQREKLSSLKLRHQMASRKMALLQQIAGKLGDPRLDDEIDKLLLQYRKHKTDWGRRYNALAMGQSLYGDLPDTPEHLQEVVKANVHPVGRARELGEAFEDLSPRKVISELIARSIDGTTRVVERESQTAAKRGEYGESIQNYAFLSEIMEDSLKRDPLKNDE